MEIKRNDSIISVIMSVYNGEKFLRLAINSILNQTYGNLEFIIIDDASTDQTHRILESFNDSRLVILRNSHNLGLTKSLNKGLQIAKGLFVARLDADDIAHPTRIEKQLNFLYQHPDTIVVGTNMELIDNQGRRLGSSEYPEDHAEIIKVLNNHSPFSHPSVMFKKSAVLEVGGYRSVFKAGQDYDLWLRLRDKGRFANIQENLLKYRIHNDQVTIKKLKLQHSLHMKARNEALGLSDYSLLDKLKGKSGTLGSKYLSIAYLQRQLNRNDIAAKTCLYSIWHSPFNTNAWKFLFNCGKSTKSYDLVKYYKNRMLCIIYHKDII